MELGTGRGGQGASAERWLLAVALATFLPFLANLSFLRKLYWFGDSWDLLNQLTHQGPWAWSATVFAENFVPVFKLLWLGCIHALGGSYLGMLCVMWITHALTVLVFGHMLRSAGFPAHGVALAMLTLGVAWTNLETLTWSIQWSASLAMLFFLVAVPPLLRLLEGTSTAPGRDGAIVLASVAASALSFSRGVLSGVALAGACAAFWWTGRCPSRRAAGWAAAALVPPVAVALTIYMASSGNHRALTSQGPEQYGAMALFGLRYLLLNPLAPLMRVHSLDPLALVVLGAAKVALIGWALWRTEGRARILLVVLAFQDLLNAALLGLGRFHTGPGAATASRYQDNSLVVFGAAVAVVYGDAIARFIQARSARVWAAALVAGLWSAYNLSQWRREVRPWVEWRGVDARALVADPNCHGEPMPGIPFLSCDRARALAARFHLH